MKKLILITTLIVCVCAFAIMHTDDSDAEVVASGTCGTNLNWEYNDASTTLTISGNGTTMIDWQYYSLPPWKDYRDNITDIFLNTPNLTKIGTYAFQNCTAITTIVIPNTVTEIGDYAFGGCSHLITVSLPLGLNKLGSATFYNCAALQMSTFPENVTVIGGSLFQGCTSLTNFTIPSRISELPNYMFYQCSKLESVTLPSGLTSIGESAFSRCSKLANITLPNGLLHIRNSAFGNCTSLAWTTLPDSVLTIGESAFYGCTKLALTTLPSGLTTIEKNTFRDCTALALISLPSGLTSIGESAFNNCPNVRITEIPNEVVSIGVEAFRNNTRITSISIPQSLLSIGKGAFYYCTNIQHIYWNAATCTAPITSTFPFANCTKLVDVTIGENVESLPNFLFYENSAVTSWTTINWNAINCADFSQDNMIFHNDKVHTVIFGDNVKHVPAYLTREFNDTLESVSFNDGLESIGDGAFQNSAIVVLSLPSTVKSVGVWSFSNCPNVMIRTLPTNMESIGSNAFANCSGITEMLIPVGFSATISDGAFANDTNLKTVLNLSDLNIEKGATTYGSIGAYADEVRNDIPSIGIVQQKDHIVHETIEKTDMASTLLRILPALMVIAILSFIVGALYYRSRDLNE